MRERDGERGGNNNAVRTGVWMDGWMEREG